jgi:hypothetical protein
VNTISAFTTAASYLNVARPFANSGVEKRQPTPEDNLQSVFSEVVERSGRSGYSSVDSISPTGSLEQDVASAWEHWFAQVGAQRYNFVAGEGSPSVRENKTSADLKQDFKEILVEAYRNEAYRNPQDYLKTLSTDDLLAIQQVQSLADPIDVSKLSDEGAMNLLLPPDAQMDSDKDGLTSVGVAYSIRFPDSNTPKSVREAWEVATAHLSERDRGILTLQMFSAVSNANMKFDTQGNWIGSAEPGDADWRNPMSSSSFSYLDFVGRRLENIERFKGYMMVDDYQQQMSFWNTFQEELVRRQVR